ncbi:acyl carrier protein [Acetobacter fallax]|uniref:Acyl carrier protein n=1 Tax=Acetobacter fallax TaxID=1737473 RepID=A0ABX0K5F6_9PROT|nr:acyl carrier protein [Acetobacter fallax]NHO30987.1 acyl carrier protein [Acetobacter fallax]NHO34544.1 acyl carrier protein [Acetobacter fallax]
MNDIYQKLQDVFRDVFDDPDIVLTPETTASDIQGWDSQAHISLIVAAEEKFGIRFRTAELESLHNVSDFADLIRKKSTAG